MLGHVLELNGLDLEEIAEALADQECYEHRRLAICSSTTYHAHVSKR